MVLGVILDWSWGPEEWTAVGTGATALIAFGAVVVAYFQLDQARKLREEQARPFVYVDILPSEVSPNILDLVIENLGNTLATDVRIHFVPEIETSLKDYDLARSALFTDGIPTLPPGRRIETLFDVSHERVDTTLPLRYDVTVSYSDRQGRRDELPYILDIGYLYGLNRVEKYGVHHAAKSLRELEKHFKKAISNKGLRVQAFSGDREVDDVRIEEALTGRRATFGNARPGEITMWFGRNVFIREAVRRVRGLRQSRS